MDGTIRQARKEWNGAAAAAAAAEQDEARSGSHQVQQVQTVVASDVWESGPFGLESREELLVPIHNGGHFTHSVQLKVTCLPLLLFSLGLMMKCGEDRTGGHGLGWTWDFFWYIHRSDLNSPIHTK